MPLIPLLITARVARISAGSPPAPVGPRLPCATRLSLSRQQAMTKCHRGQKAC